MSGCSLGIDYGMGKTNIDPKTGIRFGVISAHHVSYWWDSAESDYGDPSCPECGDEVTTELPEESLHHDYYCERCEEGFFSDSCFGDTPVSHKVDDGEIEAFCSGDDNDIFVTKSIYFTRAAFCSPCAPGACYLMSSDDGGARAYCFGHDGFEDGKAPYPVYRVDTDEEVLPKEEGSR